MGANQKNDMICTFVKPFKRVVKRNSRDWVPTISIPKPPKPFEDLVQDQNCLRKYASDLLVFFKDKKQKLGQVSQIKKWDL